MALHVLREDQHQLRPRSSGLHWPPGCLWLLCPGCPGVSLRSQLCAGHVPCRGHPGLVPRAPCSGGRGLSPGALLLGGLWGPACLPASGLASSTSLPRHGPGSRASFPRCLLPRGGPAHPLVASVRQLRGHPEATVGCLLPRHDQPWAPAVPSAFPAPWPAPVAPQLLALPRASQAPLSRAGPRQEFIGTRRHSGSPRPRS